LFDVAVKPINDDKFAVKIPDVYSMADVLTEPFPSYGIVIIVLGLLLLIVSISAVIVYR